MYTYIQRWIFFQKRESASHKRAVGWLALCTTIGAASTYSAFAKILSGSLSPLSMFFVSEVVILCAIFFSFGLMPTLKKVFHLDKKLLPPMLLIGLTSGTLAPLLVYAGLRTTSAVNASLFGNSEMAFLILLAAFVLHEQFNRVHVLSVGAIVAGMVVIALEGFTVGMHFRTGDMLLLAAGFVYAVGSITFRKSLHHCEPQIPLMIRSLTALSIFFLISPFIEHPLITEIYAFPIALIPALLGFAVIARLLNVFSFYESIDRLPVTTVSILCNLSVISSMCFSHWYLNEPIYRYHIVGAMLIIAGTVLLEFAGMHPTKKHHKGHLHQRQVQRV